MFRSKLLLITSLVAVASFIVAGTAAADVPRYQPTPTSATFTITSPMAPGDWGHLLDPGLHRHRQRERHVLGHWPRLQLLQLNHGDENITGSFTATTLSLNAVRPDGFQCLLTNAPFDGTTQTQAVTNPGVPWDVWMKVSPPQFSSDTYKNHGDYVSSQGGGNDAAHSPIGRPLNTNAG